MILCYVIKQKYNIPNYYFFLFLFFFVLNRDPCGVCISNASAIIATQLFDYVINLNSI